MSAIRVGCAVFLCEDNKLLLGLRGKDPYCGHWIIPGGGINLFESLIVTAEREMQEETGLRVRVISVSNVAEIIVPNNEHRLVIYVSAEIIGGRPIAGSDLSDVRFFDREEIENLSFNRRLTPTVEKVLQQTGWLDGHTVGTGATVWPLMREQRALAC